MKGKPEERLSYASLGALTLCSTLLCIPPLFAIFNNYLLEFKITSFVFDSLQSHGLQPARLLCPWYSPGKNTGVGSHAHLQGIFLTQGSNPCFLMSLALAGRFFTTNATWEAQKLPIRRLFFIFPCYSRKYFASGLHSSSQL